MKKVLICGATGFIGKNILLNFARIKNTKSMQLILKESLIRQTEKFIGIRLI